MAKIVKAQHFAIAKQANQHASERKVYDVKPSIGVIAPQQVDDKVNVPVLAQREDRSNGTPVAEMERLAALQKDAEEQGYRSGYTRGIEEGQRALDSNRLRMNTLIDRIPRELERQQGALDEAAVSIAMSAVVRIIGDHALDKEKAVETIRHLVQGVKADTITCLQLSPEDYEYLISQNINLSDRRIMRIAPSAKVELGGCIIDTDMGSLDARFETQLLRVKEALKRELNNGGDIE